MSFDVNQHLRALGVARQSLATAMEAVEMAISGLVSLDPEEPEGPSNPLRDAALGIPNLETMGQGTPDDG